jgi:hypothetical protein
VDALIFMKYLPNSPDGSSLTVWPVYAEGHSPVSIETESVPSAGSTAEFASKKPATPVLCGPLVASYAKRSFRCARNVV